MKNDSIYLFLQGRIGNQLFQYALARYIQKNTEKNLVIDDSEVIGRKWENSLVHYKLPGTSYVHENIIYSQPKFSRYRIAKKIYKILTHKSDYIKKYEIEKKLNPIFGHMGMFFCENGYLQPELNIKKPIYLEGYFQSPKYFEPIKVELLDLFDGKQFDGYDSYPGLDKIRDRESVCISIKIEHNVGSSMYDVCTIDYWKKAIAYINEKVKNPLYFICSDNVDYVLKNLIDVSKYDYIVQDKNWPVHVSLSVMAECKHFIIGNTTFGWWAQYLSKNNDKIVVAPSKWMAVDMPIDIYQDDWHLVEV